MKTPLFLSDRPPVEISLLFRHSGIILPSFRHHSHNCFGQWPLMKDKIFFSRWFFLQQHQPTCRLLALETQWSNLCFRNLRDLFRPPGRGEWGRPTRSSTSPGHQNIFPRLNQLTHPLPGLHQVEVAPECINLPIVSNVSHGMGPLPWWEGVGREPELDAG